MVNLIIVKYVGPCRNPKKSIEFVCMTGTKYFLFCVLFLELFFIMTSMPIHRATHLCTCKIVVIDIVQFVVIILGWF